MDWKTPALIYAMFVVAALIFTGGELLNSLLIAAGACVFFGLMGFIAMLLNGR